MVVISSGLERFDPEQVAVAEGHGQRSLFACHLAAGTGRGKAGRAVIGISAKMKSTACRFPGTRLA